MRAEDNYRSSSPRDAAEPAPLCPPRWRPAREGRPEISGGGTRGIRATRRAPAVTPLVSTPIKHPLVEETSGPAGPSPAPFRARPARARDASAPVPLPRVTATHAGGHAAPFRGHGGALADFPRPGRAVKSPGSRRSGRWAVSGFMESYFIAASERSVEAPPRRSAAARFRGFSTPPTANCFICGLTSAHRR